MKTNILDVRGILLSMTLAVAATGGFPADADSILWKQTPLDGGGSFITNYDNLDYAASFDAGPGWRVDELTWWGANALYGAMEESLFEISFFADDGTGAPGAEVASIMGEASVEEAGFRTDLTHGMLPDDALMRDVYAFSLELDAPLTLGPGAHYISIDLADTEDWSFSWMVSEASEEDSSAWLMSTASPTNGIQGLDAEDTFHAQAQSAFDLAFQVNGAVIPEPATAALLGMGLAGLSVRRLKRRA